MATTAFRSVRFEYVPSPNGDGAANLVSTRSVHGDTEGVTIDGYHVNAGSYVHADDVADYLVERALLLSNPYQADLLESLAFVIRTSGA